MPTNHRRGFHEEDTGAPVFPNGRQPNPQESIRGRQFRPLHGALQNAELMTEGEDLKLSAARLWNDAKRVANSAEHAGKHGNRRKNINSESISQIRVYENHN
jgi:hypothetical protein